MRGKGVPKGVCTRKLDTLDPAVRESLRARFSMNKLARMARANPLTIKKALNGQPVLDSTVETLTRVHREAGAA